MTKVKKFFAVLLTAFLCFTALAFAACDKEEENAATAYTVYVKDEDGNAIADVLVGICTYDESTGEKGSCKNPKKTDANGKVVLEEAEGVYVINGDTFSSTYELKEKYVLKAYGDYTIVLIAK